MKRSGSSNDIIRAAFDHGVTFFDVAQTYGPHEVERIEARGVRLPDQVLAFSGLEAPARK